MTPKEAQDKRREIEQEHTVVDGRIRDPGKFEGEAIYIPYFWDVVMSGLADEQDGGIASVPVDEEDKMVFPELKRRKRVRMLEDSQGFVNEVR